MRYILLMPPKNATPVSLRVNEEDRAILDRLQQRLGLKDAQIFKLAIRRLEQLEESKQ